METSFASLSQRMAYPALAAFTSFRPILSANASEESQRQAHAFLKGTAQRIFNDPARLGLPALPDDCYEDWQMQNAKPELIAAMRKIDKKLEDFYLLLVSLGCAGEPAGGGLFVGHAAVKVTPKALETLRLLGLSAEKGKDGLLLSSSEYPALAAGWKLLAETARGSGRDAASLFARGVFHPENPGTAAVFRELAEDQSAFGLLETFFTENEYRLVEDRNGTPSADWVKQYGGKDEPLKDSWGERTHGGLSVTMDVKKKSIVFYGLRLPMFREVLKRFDEMSAEVKDLVVSKTKKCDGCRYCIQTDKTGKRPRQIAAVSHNGKAYELCTLYPGFNYVWTHIDKKTAADMIALLSFIDRVLG